MIKENFIRLYEDAFRRNWELPGFTDYGENHTMTYQEIAVVVLPNCTCFLSSAR